MSNNDSSSARADASTAFGAFHHRHWISNVAPAAPPTTQPARPSLTSHHIPDEMLDPRLFEYLIDRAAGPPVLAFHYDLNNGNNTWDMSSGELTNDFAHPFAAPSPHGPLPVVAAAVPPPPSAVNAPPLVLLTDEAVPGRPSHRRYTNLLPIPAGVEPRYWHKLYNRADSAIRHRDPALGAASLVDGSTRHRAFELLATDVKRSLDMGASESQQVKNAAVRTASLGWTPDSPVVRELASQGITLAKSTWPGPSSSRTRGTRMADSGSHGSVASRALVMAHRDWAGSEGNQI
ncbi:hypothetical protein NEMBOFW57_003592 [Staphylotrichum longicolle]|uniref:Uncharacterized protein n=1 Tax=Staphylotrichum longicolle TaxID=669026 RepID=A0AAD4F6H9_9PEZI|nr:hypothetical protein NEMBOFW57_003592 [Staphylotrichum longicolle]